MINKPFSESCEQNKEPILAVLKHWFTEQESNVLEIGSGTGQHVCYFSKKLKHLQWYPSDRVENIEAIKAWIHDAKNDTVQPTNLQPPYTLDVTQKQWPEINPNYIFSANTAHIMSAQDVEAMFNGIRKILKPAGIFCLYGPFNYNGQFNSTSNAQFEQWLKSRDINSGIKDFETVCELGYRPSEHKPLILIDDHEMPANNRILVFQSQITK